MNTGSTPDHARLTIRTIAAYVTGVALLITVGACGGGNESPSSPRPSISTTTTTTSPSPSTDTSSSSSPSDSTSSSTASATPARCASDNLKATLTQGSGGGAGSLYPFLVLTNVGKSTCVSRGYPGVSLTAKGHIIGAAATRNTGIAAAMVTLKRGASAHAQLRIVQTGNFDADTCKPTKADALRVFPPDQRQALMAAANDLTGCANASTPIVSVGPLQPGSGQ